MVRKRLKAPFPAFGGKGRIASTVWDLIGDVDNAIEPFANSAAWLLARPHPPRVETLNDVDAYISNFWRATSKDPEAVVEHVDWPVNEADLHARHRWLVLSEEAALFRELMRRDPDYFDPRIAGWWCWGACCWIGSGWCSVPSAEVSQLPRMGNDAALRAGPRTDEQIPDLSSGGCGVAAPAPALSQQVPTLRGPAPGGVHATGDLSQQLPKMQGFASGCVPEDSGTQPRASRPQLADTYNVGRGVHVSHGLWQQRPHIDPTGTCDARRAWLIDWFRRLRDRLRLVRVCCGDWLRVCSSDSTTVRLGITGVFLDPPYPRTKADGTESRADNLYAQEGGDKTPEHLRDEVLAWCRTWGTHKLMRIVVAGYDTDGYAALEHEGWKVHHWRAVGGYGNRTAKGKANAGRERLWSSPHCKHEAGLFDHLPTSEE